MSILAALFAVSLSLTSPSQYTFTSNLFDQSFFTGTGYGNTESPPYRTLRLEDAAFLTEAFWERCSAFYMNSRSSFSENYSIGTATFQDSYNTTNGYYRSPISAQWLSMVVCGAFHSVTNSENEFVFKNSTNAINGSFFCAATTDAISDGYFNQNVGTNGEYYVHGVSTVGNIRPVITESVKYDNTSFPTNLWRFSLYYDGCAVNEDYIRSCYQLLGCIRSGVEKDNSFKSWDYRKYSINEWYISHVANAWTQYSYTYTDEYGNEHVYNSQYESGYDREEYPSPQSGWYSNYVGVTGYSHSNIRPYILRIRGTSRLYAERVQSYSYGQQMPYAVIDNGYDDSYIYYENRNEAHGDSMIRREINTTNKWSSGIGLSYPRGTRYGNLRVFFIARGVARTIHTQTYHTVYEDFITNAVTVTTNATPFVNVSKGSATLKVEGDKMFVEMPGSILEMVSDAVEETEGIFGNMPYPAKLEPTNLGGRTSHHDHGHGPVSTAEDRYLAEIVYDSIECYIQSSPTYHARVL